MSNVSFLPDDYVAQAAERRTNIVSLVLFGVVMTAVFGAFLVTNRQWTQVREQQIRMNAETEKAAADIRKMRELEEKRGQMVEKAELAMTLIEPVPRSILLAMLVNAMPERLSLIDFGLKSDEIKRPKPRPSDKDTAPAAKKDDEKSRAGASAPKVARAKTKAEADAARKDGKDAPKPEPVRYLIGVTMTGVAPTDLDVSRYMNALSEIAIFKGVRLETTEEKEIDGQAVRQFKISMYLDPDADIRAMRGTHRPEDPMSARMKLSPTGLRSGAGDDAPGTDVSSPTAPASPPLPEERNHERNHQ